MTDLITPITDTFLPFVDYPAAIANADVAYRDALIDQSKAYDDLERVDASLRKQVWEDKDLPNDTARKATYLTVKSRDPDLIAVQSAFDDAKAAADMARIDKDRLRREYDINKLAFERSTRVLDHASDEAHPVEVPTDD